MAVRDRNLFAWQAYVITMSFISVGLLLGMFFLWRSYSDQAKRLAEKDTQLTTAGTEFATSEARVQRLLSMVGHGKDSPEELQEAATRFAADELLGPVEKEFATQMNQFAQNTAASEKNLMKLPKYLLDTIRARNEDIEKARERATLILAEKTETLRRETKAREDAETAQKKAEADLEATRQQHAESIAKLNAEKDEAIALYSKFKSDYEVNIRKLMTQNTELTNSNQTLTQTVQKKMDELTEFTNLDFANPQGKVTQVAEGGTVVWINLGRDDGLREGVSFTVIDESAINTSEAKDKAHIVVTNVIADHPHLSRAKVTDYSPTRPIMSEDKVFSPAWRAGRTVGFALVGEMDLNGDLRDDVADVRDLIKRSGGVIDAEMDSKGARMAGLTGLNANTEYLVLGTDIGVIKEQDNQSLAKQENYKRFLAEARQYGIAQISVDKLMGYLKADQSQRVVPMGERIQGKDFPPEKGVTPQSSRGPVSDLFQKRQPLP